MARWISSFLLPFVFAVSTANAAPTRLTAEDREALRYRLENLFNEVDLLLRNQNVNLADVGKQQREMEALKVYERIPFSEELPGLKQQLAQSAKAHGLELAKFKVVSRAPKPSPVPREIFSDSDTFRLRPEQVAQEIRFTATVHGDSETAVRAWLKGWQENQMRLVEPEGGYEKFPVSRSKDGFTVKAHAFRYRELEFPRLRTRDPLQLLPGWARRDPKAFARAEPVLWSFVERTRELTPKARPLYETRREFQLLQARMDFFLHKATPKGVGPGTGGHSH